MNLKTRLISTVITLLLITISVITAFNAYTTSQKMTEQAKNDGIALVKLLTRVRD